MNEDILVAPVISGLELLGAGTSFTAEICEMLHKIPLFDDFTTSELAQVASHMHAFRAPQNTLILKEGDRTSYLFIVLEGSASVYKEDTNGTRKRLAQITAGKSFGEMSLIDDLPCSADICTDTTARLLLIGRDNFRRLIEHHPMVGGRLLWRLARLISLRLRQTSSQLVDYLG